MSILIKGMKMPSGCRDCPFAAYYERSGSTWCNARKKPLMEIPLARDYQPIKFDGRRQDCPLVEIKTPHGRLIEEPKKLDYGGLVHIAPLDFVGIAKYFYNQIHALPTVIEAEEEREE